MCSQIQFLLSQSPCSNSSLKLEFLPKIIRERRTKKLRRRLSRKAIQRLLILLMAKRLRRRETKRQRLLMRLEWRVRSKMTALRLMLLLPTENMTSKRLFQAIKFMDILSSLTEWKDSCPTSTRKMNSGATVGTEQTLTRTTLTSGMKTSTKAATKQLRACTLQMRRLQTSLGPTSKKADALPVLLIGNQRMRIWSKSQSCWYSARGSFRINWGGKSCVVWIKVGCQQVERQPILGTNTLAWQQKCVLDHGWLIAGRGRHWPGRGCRYWRSKVVLKMICEQ